MNYSEKDLALISSTESIVQLLLSDPFDIESVMTDARYRHELHKLQIELLRMQKCIIRSSRRVLVIFEGVQFSGKGMTIRSILEHLNPRAARSIALPKPTAADKKRWYFQRYVQRFPEPGELVLFDRSWYNRAIVEPVHGFCTKKEYGRFMEEVIDFEKMLVKDGMQILKFYFHISKEEQARRIAEVKKDPLRNWRLSKVDRMAQELWDQIKEYEHEMIEKTSIRNVPWIMIDGNVQREADLDTIRQILKRVPYEC